MRIKVLVLALCMLFFGSINTIVTKHQDLQKIGEKADGTPIYFQHPAFQSACMFFGESLCLIPHFYFRWRKRKLRAAAGIRSALAPSEKLTLNINRIFAFAVPALCDACATTLLNIGLFYTYASVFQMLRGTLVLFAGMFTIIILRRQLHIHHWLGMVLITAGAALVGAASVLYNSAVHPQAATAPLFGDILVFLAQMFAALQFILEEKFLSKYRVPALLAVGIEGCWGMVLSLLVLPFTAHFKTPDGLSIDNPIAALQQMGQNAALLTSVLLSVLSIAFFNFFGLSVTKSLSGAARATIDAVRTLFIWLFSIAVGWETFTPLQVLGFIVLISGTSLYNEIIKPFLPGPKDHSRHDRSRSRAAVPTSADGAGVTEPLLPTTVTPPPTLPPVRVPRPPRQKPPADPLASLNSASDLYTMARSMRLGASALSPHSLDSVSESFPDTMGSSMLDSTPYLNTPMDGQLSLQTPPRAMSGDLLGSPRRSRNSARQRRDSQDSNS